MRIGVPSNGGFEGHAVPFENARDIAVAEVGPDGVKEIKVLRLTSSVIKDMKDNGIEVVIAPEFSRESLEILSKEGISTVTGVTGKVREILLGVANGTIKLGLKTMKMGMRTGMGFMRKL